MHKLAVVAALLLSATNTKDSRFFTVDLDKKIIVGTTAQVPAALRLDLIAVSTDQPQYWPNEKVFLKVIALGFGGARVKATLQKRDAAAVSSEHTLDAQGVAVVELMNGEASKLQLGEYRVDLEIVGKGKRGSSTFAVVEGTLGALSFAHEFKKVTSADGLEKEKGAWFLGNASGAGKRWGNGLSFKNELRVDNKPYQGTVDIHSRCMLPGCNGTYAGRSMLGFKVENGVVAGTLDVGGHSGPFQIEVITPKGSLRHQFEGSSHVERDMVMVSGGLSFTHIAGLAPYENTVQVPGRQLFIESKGAGNDAWSLPNVIAKDGRVTIAAKRKVSGVTLVTYSPTADGSFTSTKVVRGEMDKDSVLAVEVADPFSFVTVGGFSEGRFVEGWAIVFRPSAMELGIDAPAMSAPKQTITVRVDAKLAGKGVKVSGILEAYDNRVASKSAIAPLGSAIGDGMRNAANAVLSWQDNTGIEERKHDRFEDEEAKDMAPAAEVAAPPPPPAPPKSMPSPMKKSMSPKVGAIRSSAAGQPQSVAKEDEEAPAEAIREGEKKVVYCQRVETDASGSATVQITLPPQLGRVTLRFVAVSGFDHASTQRDVDSSKDVSADLRAPKVFVPGAQLSLPLRVSSTKAVSVTVSGPGVASFTRDFAAGDHSANVSWVPTVPGKLVAETRDGARKVLDRRELSVTPIADQPVTYSRIEIGMSPAVAGPGETVKVYKTTGELLQGVVMAMFTTMESWFGHAEALSAKIAAHSVIAAALSRGYLQDDGMQANVLAALDKSMRDLEEAFIDSSGLVRPYPGLPPSALWSGWVAKNLNDAVQALAQAKSTDARITNTLAAARRVREKIDVALQKQGMWADGYDKSGNDVIPIEIDGRVVYRAVTDDAVTKWAAEKLVPYVVQQKAIDQSKLFDTFRFMRAFERVGALQYLTDVARGLLQKGDTQSFLSLYKTIARGMILAQEPGMLQGPAMLGGVYSTPMALVRFLELELAMAEKPLPGMVISRVDSQGTVHFAPGGETLAQGQVSKSEVAPGGQLGLRIELSAQRDPLEYVALIAVPSTTSVKQTEDILSDYRGQLIYGQQGMGSTQMQVIAVPFRGKRTLDLLLEGAFVGTSPGMVIVRHIESPQVSVTLLPSVTVR